MRAAGAGHDRALFRAVQGQLSHGQVHVQAVVVDGFSGIQLQIPHGQGALRIPPEIPIQIDVAHSILHGARAAGGQALRRQIAHGNRERGIRRLHAIERQGPHFTPRSQGPGGHPR